MRALILLSVVLLVSSGRMFAQEEREPQTSGPLNWETSTLGGKQWWTDVRHCSTWRIQRNAYTGHHRLLDGDDVRRAWGSWEHCQAELEGFRQKENVPAMKGKAIVLMHGLARSRSSMEPLAEYLSEQGGFQVFNFTYASTRLPIEEHAQALASVIQGLDGIEEIHFVGHSMGNLVMRHYFADALKTQGRIDPRIRRMVMLAPPNHGSQLATSVKDLALFGAVWGVSGLQIANWQSLAPQLATPPCEFAIIAGGYGSESPTNPWLPGNDDFVVTVEEARLRGARDFVVLPSLHSLILKDPKVHEFTLRFLREGHFISEQARQPLP